MLGVGSWIGRSMFAFPLHSSPVSFAPLRSPQPGSELALSSVSAISAPALRSLSVGGVSAVKPARVTNPWRMAHHSSRIPITSQFRVSSQACLDMMTGWDLNSVTMKERRPSRSLGGGLRKGAKRKHANAFSLVELLVVIAILGIL